MKKVPNDLIVGSIFNTENYGKCTVVKYTSNKDIKIKFLATGYISTVQASHLRRGAVKDFLAPSVLGIGYLGIGEYSTSSHKSIYLAWKSMLARCYDLNYQKNQPTYSKCTVSTDWHCFQEFCAWYIAECNRLDINPTKNSYCLDKDIMGDGTIYSKETCSLVTHQKNNERAHSKSYSFKSPTGELVNLYNISKFAKENGLHASALCRVNVGKQISHLGWTRP